MLVKGDLGYCLLCFFIIKYFYKLGALPSVFCTWESFFYLCNYD